MSQVNFDAIKATTPEELLYTIPVTYFRMQYDPKKGPMEVEEKGHIKFFKPSRRNSAHAGFIMDWQQNRNSPLEQAVKFVNIFCADEKVKEDLAGDGLACVAALASKEATDQFEIFFDKWELTKRVPEESQPVSE